MRALSLLSGAHFFKGPYVSASFVPGKTREYYADLLWPTTAPYLPPTTPARIAVGKDDHTEELV